MLLLLPPSSSSLTFLFPLQLLATTLHVASSAATVTVTTNTPVPNLSQNTSDACIASYQTPNIRYPPLQLVNNDNNSSTTNTNTNTMLSQSTPWNPPTQPSLWSPYAITHSTRPYYLTLPNMQATHYPLFPSSTTYPPGSQIDIVSWSRNHSHPNHNSNSSSSPIVTVFGYFTPLQSSIATWRYSSTGPLVNVTNLWAILGWGVDDEGVGYRIDYETGYQVKGGHESDAKPCINVASRRVGGPSNTTYGQIVEGLMQVGMMAGDHEFVELVGKLRRLRSDGRRDDLKEVECDEACVMNRDLIPG